MVRSSTLRATPMMGAWVALAIGAAPTVFARDTPAAPTSQPDASALQPSFEVAAVTAHGSGCPTGTWRSQVSDDGRSVTLDFDDFIRAPTRATPVAQLDCAVSIKLRSGEALSYAPAVIATRADSAWAEFETEVAWAAQPGGRRTFTRHQGGSNGYVLLAGDQWSPCGAEQELLLGTGVKMELQPNTRPSAVPPNVHVAQSKVTFSARRCDPGAPVALPVAPLAGLSAFGSKCSNADVLVVPSDDGSSLDLEFGRFDSDGDKPAFCNIDLMPARGQAIAITSYTLHGTQVLPPGATRTISVAQGGSDRGGGPSLRYAHRLTGPVEGAFEVASDHAGQPRSFSGCGPDHPITLSVDLGSKGPSSSEPSRLAITSLRNLKLVAGKCSTP